MRIESMMSRIVSTILTLLLCLAFWCAIASADELARVEDSVITSDEFLEECQFALMGRYAPEKSPEGKREFLDRLISKRLLSSYFHSQGWDTIPRWDAVLAEYSQFLYLQAIYRDEFWEARNLKIVADLPAFQQRCMLFADSLVAAYGIEADKTAVALMADRTLKPMKEAPKDEHGQPVLSWVGLFTDEEKAMTAATLSGGKITIGEFLEKIGKEPAFARPTGGNTDEITLAIEHMGKDKVYALEFERRNLGQQDWYRERMHEKREELILMDFFRQVGDTCTVTEEEMRSYYEENTDDFRTSPLIKVATIRVESLGIARKIAEKIEEGQDFESVAVDFSVYSITESPIDTVGFVDRSGLDEVFTAIWDREIGTVVGPIFERNSWTIAKLIDREEMRLLSYEEARQRIEERLRLRKSDAAFAGFLEELRAQADVEIDYEALDALELP
jgi:peptidyl-prolyl cis-trans isomerase C